MIWWLNIIEKKLTKKQFNQIFKKNYKFYNVINKYLINMKINKKRKFKIN